MTLAPSLAAALLIWALYTLVTVAVQMNSGIAYAQWFATAGNAWRTGVLSLAAGVVLLIGWWLVTRWSHVWRDPVRLPTSRLMRAALVLWWLIILVRMAGIRWSEVPLDLLLAIVASGVLVGFAEETLFRGYFLRCMREGGRSEFQAALWTALAFGAFHLPNVFMGTGAVGLFQVILAALSGIVLYGFRRHFGLIWPAMVAHGAWDISTFLSGSYASEWLGIFNLVMMGVNAIIGLALMIGLRHDRSRVALPSRQT